ncbi:hypothetical protein [Vibrio phage RYC]|nr:hypothetical protein [Vibrio phage RYC]
MDETKSRIYCVNRDDDTLVGFTSGSVEQDVEIVQDQDKARGLIKGSGYRVARRRPVLCLIQNY